MATWKGCGDGILCTVRKRDGAQVFACRVIWNGKQYTEQAGTSKLDAYALKKKREDEITAGTYLPPKIRKHRDAAAEAARRPARPKLREWTDERIEVKRAHLKRRSLDAYRDRCSKFQNAPIGELYLHELTRRDVEAWVSTVRGRDGAREVDVKPYLDALKIILNDAVRNELISSNPAASVKAPKRARRKGVYIEPADRAKLIAAAHPDLRPALRFSFLVGARWGELAGLEWRDVDLAAKRLTIARTAGETTTKTGEARTIRLNDDALAVLSKLPTRFAGGIVFTFNGRPLIEAKPGRFRLTMLRPYDREWSRACRAAGLSGIRPHDTRHTFASDFVMKTGNLFALTKLCGWSDYKMVERTYGHLTEGFMENEMKLMNGAAGEV